MHVSLCTAVALVTEPEKNAYSETVGQLLPAQCIHFPHQRTPVGHCVLDLGRSFQSITDLPYIIQICLIHIESQNNRKNWLL
jgi:hypothetical protein